MHTVFVADVDRGLSELDPGAIRKKFMNCVHARTVKLKRCTALPIPECLSQSQIYVA